jgi:redox-sensitive bicupin YhaK (pirin superfamily)
MQRATSNLYIQREADMINVRKAADRGSVNLGWLDTKHTFSFGSYHDPDHMGFGKLRVINDDRIEPGRGFGTHPHNDMEIVSYVVEGSLEHKDNMGNGSIIRAGEVQRMTAGTGITHSEFNPSPDEQMRLLQIWIEPESEGLDPGYEQKHFSAEEKSDQLRLIVSRDGREGSLLAHQDMELYASLLSSGSEVRHRFAAGRKGWIQVVSGELIANGEQLESGDGAAIEDTAELLMRSQSEAEFLLFDLG